MDFSLMPVGDTGVEIRSFCYQETHHTDVPRLSISPDLGLRVVNDPTPDKFNALTHRPSTAVFQDAGPVPTQGRRQTLGLYFIQDTELCRSRSSRAQPLDVNQPRPRSMSRVRLWSRLARCRCTTYTLPSFHCQALLVRFSKTTSIIASIH
ncbi:hypothetical protein BDZ94DRAFT_1267918 [Collybia nuda]|uniref:Uncharacterized protein n=1 Tax=Collybia nuda TaxID=64659 RepID=A0A9P5XZK5_9AGAR|nr:hypothetical protein BDZ94DRAFT_1267918 [Collybia nuda]